MFRMNIQNMIQEATGGENVQQLETAARDHISSMDSGDLTQHLQTGANNASQAGQHEVAQELTKMVEQRQVDPQALKDMAVSYIKSNPQVLTHFAPTFAQGILNRVI
ncbi:MAG: hypothetical protein ABR584_05605 [Candidatus Baltobacteraceae bacterium]